MNNHRIRRIAPNEAHRIEYLLFLAARDERVRARKSPEQLRLLERTGVNLIAHYAQSKAGVFVAETQDGLVGLGMVPLVHENGIIYVQPEHRRQKIGTGLFNAINHARETIGAEPIHPDKVFGYALPHGYVAPVTGGW